MELLQALEAGPVGDETYEMTDFTDKIHRVLPEGASLGRYLELLQRLQRCCCQHGKNASCDLPRCSGHIREEVDAEEVHLIWYQRLCYLRGRLNTVAGLHRVIEEISMHGDKGQFTLLDADKADPGKAEVAHLMLQAMRAMLRRMAKTERRQWLMTSTEFQSGTPRERSEYIGLVKQHCGFQM